MTEKKFVGFPDITQNPDNADELSTRPMALYEMPLQVRIDHEMAIIKKHHERIAKSIDIFWGHRDCVEYLEQLILNGGDGFGSARVGFKHEVIDALIKLTSLHDIQLQQMQKQQQQQP